MLDTALILFVRNPILGKVKTRLAKTIGDEKALEVYRLLLSKTHNITCVLSCAKFVYYADEVAQSDLWSKGNFIKKAQCGNDLGERMYNAFADLKLTGFHRILIIGSDCYELTNEILQEAFEQLKSHDAVIGPAYDGGYYLLGMKKLMPGPFKNKNWGTNTVCSDTIDDFVAVNASYVLMPVLNDVDEKEDLLKSKIEINTD